jgi:hypothetical protein
MNFPNVKRGGDGQLAILVLCVVVFWLTAIAVTGSL